jgi:hypothetical protein
MIKPLEDKITHLVDRILPYGDAIKPKIGRVRPYGKTDPASAPPGYNGPFIPAPPHHVTVISDPSALDELIVEYSPNAPTTVSVEATPNAATTATVVHSPNAPATVDVEYSTNAATISVEHSPNAATQAEVQHSPNAPASIDTQPNAPALIEVEQETVLPGSITVEHSPNAPVIDSAEAYAFTAPYLGPWRFEMTAEKQTDYVAVLVPLAYADDPNVGNYPDGFELEILKVQEYLSSVAQGVIDLVKTDDGLIGGTEQAQVFEMSDRGISWQYADIAQDPTAVNYSLYRGLARPPVEPASVSVEHSPNAVSTVDADTEPLAPSLVESGLLANPVQSIDVQTDPYGITSISVEHSPNSPTIDQILYQEPNPVQSVIAEELFPPNAVASVNSSVLLAPNQVSSVSVETSPNAPASLSVGHLPAQPSVINANTPPLPVSLVDAQTEPLQPAQITSATGSQAPASITAEHTPNAPTVVTAGELANAPAIITAQALVPGAPIFPLQSVTVETSPNAPTVDSVAYMQNEPAQPASVTSARNPNAPQVVTSGQPPQGVGQLTAGTFPAQPASITSGQAPAQPTSITAGQAPAQPASITSGQAPAQPASITSQIATGLWTPVSLTNNVFWIDANNSSSLTISGGEVTEVQDLSGNNFDVTPPSSSYNPTIASTTQNGKTLIEFDGTDHLANNSITTPTSGNLQAFIVCEATGIVNGNDSILSMDASNNDWQLCAGSSSLFQGQIKGVNIGESSTGVGNESPSGMHIWNASFDYDSGEYLLRIDGDQLGGTSIKNYTTKMSSSMHLRVFANRSSWDSPGGKVAEVIIYEDVTEGQRQKVEGYLAHKWGLEGLLDSAHPYKSNAPTLGASSTLNVSIIADSTVIEARTGDPTGTLAYGNNNQRIYVYTGTSWIYFNNN